MCVFVLMSVYSSFSHFVIDAAAESGAGKTETAKMVLRYLVSRASSSSALPGDGAGLDQRLLQSTPILECFGNGKTLRNSNSSRFGKFMKLVFSQTSPGSGSLSITGARVATYLLETSRVTSQIRGEVRLARCPPLRECHPAAPPSANRRNHPTPTTTTASSATAILSLLRRRGRTR